MKIGPIRKSEFHRLPRSRRIRHNVPGKSSEMNTSFRANAKSRRDRRRCALIVFNWPRAGFSSTCVMDGFLYPRAVWKLYFRAFSASRDEAPGTAAALSNPRNSKSPVRFQHGRRTHPWSLGRTGRDADKKKEKRTNGEGWESELNPLWIENARWEMTY